MTTDDNSFFMSSVWSKRCRKVNRSWTYQICSFKNVKLYLKLKFNRRQFQAHQRSSQFKRYSQLSLQLNHNTIAFTTRFAEQSEQLRAAFCRRRQQGEALLHKLITKRLNFDNCLQRHLIYKCLNVIITQASHNKNVIVCLSASRKNICTR